MIKMKLIQINKTLLIVAFFMPFIMAMCSREENLNFGKNKIDAAVKTVSRKSTSTDYLSYLLYPTEYSLGGFGVTYHSFANVARGNFRIELLELIPLAFITSLSGLALTSILDFILIKKPEDNFMLGTYSHNRFKR
jgi:hypothetical protein